MFNTRVNFDRSTTSAEVFISLPQGPVSHKPQATVGESLDGLNQVVQAFLRHETSSKTDRKGSVGRSCGDDGRPIGYVMWNNRRR
jgi:hypothetical protein